MSMMDELDRRRFLETLRKDDDFRAVVRRELLTDELLNLPQSVATLIDVVAQQRRDFKDVATDVRTYMDRTIALIGDGFTAVSSEMSNLGTQVQDNVSELREGVSELQGNMRDLRENVSELRTDMDAGFAGVRAELDQVHAEIREIKDQLAS